MIWSELVLKIALINRVAAQGILSQNLMFRSTDGVCMQKPQLHFYYERLENPSTQLKKLPRNEFHNFLSKIYETMSKDQCSN